MARPSTAARRYAEAAFELALRDDALDAWNHALGFAAEAVSSEQVAVIVDNPARPLATRIDVVDRLLAQRVPSGALNLVRLLVQRGRVDQLPRVAAEFQRLLNRRRGVVEALVTTASPLTPDEIAAVRARVTGMSGGEVDLEIRVDEALIGGLTVRVGDQLVDASVRGRLERLRTQLVSGARSAH
jgi:F-type H+-transporting ATPase subunit delta